MKTHQPSLLLSKNQRLMPGILGGLGPLAHIEFERCLLSKSVEQGAQCDQDHPVWLLVNATATPDRTRSLNNAGADCMPWLLQYAQLLESMGADFLVVTCNTAHAFYDRIQPQLQIPWIHAMRSVSRTLVTQHAPAKKVGVMCTSGTLRAQLYTQSLKKVGLLPVTPEVDSDIQRAIMQSIYAPEWGIKASGVSVSERALQQLSAVMRWFEQQGADIVVAGCTELSVGLARINDLPLPWVDPLEILADLTLSLASGEAIVMPPKTGAASIVPVARQSRYRLADRLDVGSG